MLSPSYRMLTCSSELGVKNKEHFNRSILSNSRLMTSFWISLVPSPMVHNLLSR